MKTLIVDDHALVRRGLALIILESFESSEVVEAGNAEEAIEALNADGFDIALLDVRMPVVDGIELLKKVKAGWPDLPVIMLTTFDHSKFARAALAEGAAGYMLKDSTPADLQQAIKVAISGGGNVLSSKVIQGLFDDLQAGEVASSTPQPANLTHRETEVLDLLVEGKSNRDISTELFLSEKTVKAHLAAVFRKLGVSNRTQAAMAALNMGLGNRDASPEDEPVEA